jgi:hypothetical protein
MADATPTYRKLSGRSGFFIVHRTRIADDHLLAVRTAFFFERYQRLFFRDLQTLSIHPTARRLWTGVITGVISLLFALGAWGIFVSETVFPYALFALVGAIALIAFGLFVLNLALGPSCMCYVRTAVQTVQLPSLNRVRRAMRARSMIGQLVAAAQTQLEVETLTPTGSGTTANPPMATASAAVRASVPLPGVPSASGPAIIDRAALLASGATGVFSLIAALGILYDFVETALPGFFASLITVLAALVAAIVHLVMARAKRLAAAVRAPALGVIFLTIGGAIFGYVMTIVIAMGQATRALNSPAERFNPMSGVSAMSPGTNAVVDVYYYTMVAAFGAAGVWALVVCARLGVAHHDAKKPAS